MGGEIAHLKQSIHDDDSAEEWDKVVYQHFERKKRQKESAPKSLLEASMILTSKIKDYQEKIFTPQFNSGSSGIYNLSERESAHSFVSRIGKRKVMEKRRAGLLMHY